MSKFGTATFLFTLQHRPKLLQFRLRNPRRLQQLRYKLLQVVLPTLSCGLHCSLAEKSVERRGRLRRLLQRRQVTAL